MTVSLPRTWNRAVLHRWDILMLVTMLGCSVTAQAADPARVAIEWKVPERQVDDARQHLRLTPNQVSEDKASVSEAKIGLPALYILAGIVALPDLAEELVRVYKKVVYGTTIVTCSADGKCAIDHDPKGNDDTIVVKSGARVNVEIHNRKSLDSTQWMKLILDAIPGKKS